MSSEWPLVPLEDCLDALIDYRGKTPEKTDSGVPLVTAKVIKGGRIETPSEFIAHDEYDSWMRRGIPKPGDVVMTTEAPLGEVAQLGTAKVALAQRVITLRGKAGFLDNTYLLYLLQTAETQEQLKARATGTTVLGIKQSELRKVGVLVPPFELQQSAAQTLKALDDRITLLRETNATLEAIAQALFKSWFVDFDPVRAKQQGRAPEGMDEATAALFPDGFEESALGLVPRGWRRTLVGNVCEQIFSGGTPDTRKPEYWNGNIPWFSSGETRNRIVTDTEKKISQTAVDSSSTKLASPGDILIASAGQGHTRGQTAYCSINTYINQSVVSIRADRAKCHPLWLFYNLSRRYEEMRNLSDSHSSRGSLTTKLLAQMPILIPSLPAINAFAEVVSVLIESQVSNDKQAQTLATLRDTLLPRLISSQLRLPEAEALAMEASA